ncbi:PQQ-dependent sugar dehydrogenase [Halobacteria archaeon AArc-dxtr1]|nr:PQQ-dependent sugar dehydrogenase [Halobacteria archaeon AArc-dxtr1]
MCANTERPDDGSTEETQDHDDTSRRLLQGAGAAAGATALAGCADIVDDIVDDDDDELADEWHRDIDAEADPDAATDWDNYEVTEILELDDVQAIDVAPDGKVWYVNRGAHFVTHGSDTCQIGWVDPDSGDHEVALELDVTVGNPHEETLAENDARETGGQGITFDPDFEENGYVYVSYHPAWDDMEDIGPSPYEEFYEVTDEIDHDGDVSFGYQLVSRFEVTDDDTIDPDSETEIIRIPEQFDYCCHRGGDLEFDNVGHLYISTGDDVTSGWSLWSPADDREMAHPAFDARRTAANTADLRGSILRIIPQEDGGYTVPPDNLFPFGEYQQEISEGKVRPEIYSMGYRNPYRIEVDDHTGAVFVGDYAPAGNWTDERGPDGMATYHLLCEPQNAGWPLFKGYYPYRRWDYEEEEPGQPYWPDNLRNDSRNNTGLEKLPDATPALVWQAYSSWNEYPVLAEEELPWVDLPRPGEPTWPELPTSGSANAGIAYRYSDDYGEGALDPYFEGKQFLLGMYDHSDERIYYLTFNEDGSIDIDTFMPDNEFETPSDTEVGPNGRLFLADYGGWTGDEGAIYMIEYDP